MAPVVAVAVEVFKIVMSKMVVVLVMVLPDVGTDL